MSNNQIIDKLLPLFELTMEHGMETIYFKNKNLSYEPLNVEIWDDEVEIHPLVKKSLSMGFTFKMVYYIDAKCGRFITAMDYIIPDESCIGLYKHNIEVEGVKNINGKNVYDRMLIERKATLYSLIND